MLKKCKEFEKYFSLNIKPILLGTVLIDFRCVQLDSAVYLTLSGHFLSLILKIFCREPIPKPAKASENSDQNFVSFLASNNDT